MRSCFFRCLIEMNIFKGSNKRLQIFKRDRRQNFFFFFEQLRSLRSLTMALSANMDINLANYFFLDKSKCADYSQPLWAFFEHHFSHFFFLLTSKLVNLAGETAFEIAFEMVLFKKEKTHKTSTIFFLTRHIFTMAYAYTTPCGSTLTLLHCQRQCNDMWPCACVQTQIAMPTGFSKFSDSITN